MTTLPLATAIGVILACGLGGTLLLVVILSPLPALLVSLPMRLWKYSRNRRIVRLRVTQRGLRASGGIDG